MELKLTNKEQFLENVHNFLEEATVEEFHILQALLIAAKAKQNGEYRSYLSALLKVESRFLENGNYEVRIPIEPLIYNPLQIVHGGITASLIDIAMGSLVYQSIPEHYKTVTTELKVNYLKPGIGQQLICVASLVHKGNSICVTQAEVLNEKGTIIAIATGSFFIIKPKITKDHQTIKTN